MVKKYFASFLKLPWSFLFLINLVCFLILGFAQQSNKIVCPENGQCAKDIIQTYNLKGQYAYMTMISYFLFYIGGLFFAHGYAFYSESKGNELNGKLAKTLACFLVAIIVVFPCSIGFVYLRSGQQF
jgi:hypothetical protein